MTTAAGNKRVPLLQALDRGQIDGVVHQLLVLLGLDHALAHVQHARLQALIQAISKLQGVAQLQTRPLTPGICEGDTGCLSYSQLQMFTLQQLKPTSTAYNVVRAVRITNAPLRMDALQATCDALLMKHDVLRTCFRSNWRGDPQQTVHPLDQFKNERSVKVVEFHDHRNDASLSKFIVDNLNHPFDLENDLLVRFFVIPSHDEEAHSRRNAISSWVLVVVMHHIVTDAASSVLFWQDFAQLYRRFSEQGSDPDEYLNIVQTTSGERVTYRDYALWQRNRLAGGILATSLNYWIQHLSGELPKLDLPADYNSHPVSEVEERISDVTIFQSSSVLQKRFAAFCKSHSATMFMGLLSIFHLLLSRLAHCDDIIIGAPVSGRIQEAVETVMGYFVNTLPFRIQSKQDESFDQFFNTVREVVLNGLTNMEIPLQHIIEHSPLPRRESEAENPLFKVMFAWETNTNNSSSLTVNGRDYQEQQLFEEITLSNQAAKFDLMLSMRLGCNAEGDTVLEGSMVYDTHIFHRDTIDRFAQYFLILLENCMNSPATKLSEISMLPANEQKQLVHQWGSPSASTEPFPTANYHEMFIDECVQSQVASTPNNIAVQWEGAEWSYQELWAQSARVACSLDRICSSKAYCDHLRVGIYLDRGLTNVAAILGALRVKAVFVPLDTAFPIDRIQYMVADSQAHVLISQRSHADQIEQLLPGNYQNEQQVQVLFWEELVDVTEANLCIPQSKKNVLQEAAEMIAYLLYTSGSTGKPKGVMVSHANLLTTLRWTVREYNLTPNDVFLQSTSCTLDGSLTQLFSPLLVGAQALITKTNGLHDLEYIQGLIMMKGVTLCVFVPSYFAMLMEFMPTFPRSVRYVILAGESLSMALAQKFYTKHFTIAGSIADAEHVPCLVNEYGPTEASVTSTFYRLPRSLALSELDDLSRPSNASSIAALQSVPIGKPIDDHLVLVLDAKKNLVPVNVTGELYIGGRGVAKGYWRQPGLTAERFTHLESSSTGLLPAESKVTWYKSGDLVKWLPSGDLLFIGRTDSQVKLNGMRIELQEIQNVLLQYDSVQDAEVIVQNKQRLVGYVILNNQSTNNSVLSLRDFLKKRLPPHMVPQEIRVIQEWPRTPNGKLDVRALETSLHKPLCCDQESHEEDSALVTKHGAKSPKAVDSDAESVQVQMAVNVLKLAWMEVLDLPDDACLYSSSFFELGGNSLSAIRVISLVKAHGLSLKLESFFRCESLVEMARAASSIMGVTNLQTLVPLNYARDLGRHQLNGAKKKGYASSTIGKGPLFMVHDAEGTVWKLLELARLLPFQVIGIQSGGTTSESIQPDSVELLADKYWHVIQSIQTQGPYSLGGFSFGCRVAHAIARLAYEQGHEVNPLILVDGLPVTLQHPSLDAPFDPASLHDNITQQYQSKRSASAGFQSHEHCAESEFLDHVAAQFVAHCAMDVKYQPYHYSALPKCDRKPWLRCHLFKTEWWEVPIERFSAWGITMELHQVPGTHSTLLQRPNVQALAHSIIEHASA